MSPSPATRTTATPPLGASACRGLHLHPLDPLRRAEPLRGEEGAPVRSLPLTIIAQGNLRLADWPPRRPPALQAIHHDADVRVAGFDRPTGSPVRGPSM